MRFCRNAVGRQIKTTDLVLCTVTPGRYDGWKPRTPLVLPSDGLCDYLFISKMQLYLFTLPNQTNVNKLQPFDLDEGLEKFYGDWSPLDAFMNYTASYKQTELGADMDHLFFFIFYGIDYPPLLKLPLMAPKRIRHYGLLNVNYDRFSSPDPTFPSLKRYFELLTHLKYGDKSRKVVLGVGFQLYQHTSDQFAIALEAIKEMSFDILILITSTSIGMRSGPKGFPAPNEMDGTFPWHFNMEQGSKYANEIYTYKTKKPMVGISLQMAATRLLTNASYYSSSVIDYIRHTSPDKACEAPSKNRKYLPAPAWLSWVTNKTWTETFIYDDNKTFRKKVSYARKLNRYPKFAWLVYNVHLAPTSSKCNWDQYYLLKLLKGMYK
ncbi:hypothetical protein MTO96_001604 [Rhipicephalus appendiculatus]